MTPEFTCSGLAIKYNEWIDRDPQIDPPDTLSLRFLPGAFAGALQRPDAPRSRITIDHCWRADRLHVLNKPTCCVEFWEEADGLHFEARNLTGRTYSLIEKRWIKHNCLEMLLPDGKCFPPGTSIDVYHVPYVYDLALILFALPHSRSTSVNAGPAAVRGPAPQSPVSAEWHPERAVHRVVDRSE
jgi:hypothetical protein